MTTLRFSFQGEKAGPKFSRGVQRQRQRVLSSMRAAAVQSALQIVQRGRADIAGAGNFGSRWTLGLQARVTEGGGNIKVMVTHAVSYFWVFQKGAVIYGKPLLWIPLSFAAEAQGVRARDYPGRLFRVDRKVGAPLLLSVEDRQPKYFGKEFVVEPKKFHVVEIIQDVARHLDVLYRRAFRNFQEQK